MRELPGNGRAHEADAEGVRRPRRLVTIDIDKWRGIEDVFLIDQMPAQIFYDAKGEPIWKHTGSVDADTMRERVNILIEGSKS